MTLRTQAEIIARVTEARARDPFAFEWGEYIEHLTDWEVARPMLKPDCTREEFDALLDGQSPLERLKHTNERAKAYLDFFRDKIECERGLSVGRATMHYTAWKWLLGHPDADTFPGSFASESDGGWYQRAAYDYLKAQVDSGEWDQMSAAILGGGAA